jgi:hypothetical protein
MSPPSIACRPRPVPGAAAVRGAQCGSWRHAAVMALALWGAGQAQADPLNEAGSAAEAEAAQQSFVAEWGSPLSTQAALPSRLDSRLDDWRLGERRLVPRQTGGSLLVSRTRLEAESHRREGPHGVEPVGTGAWPQRAGLDMDNIAYRWWFARRGQSIALGVGAATYRVQAIDESPLQEFGHATLSSPLISVGVRQQVSESALLYLDAASARRLSADDAGGDYYGARAGVEWQTSRNGTFALEQGRMRVRLYSGTHSQMSLRIKRGGPMLVYRLSF